MALCVAYIPHGNLLKLDVHSFSHQVLDITWSYGIGVS
jgi:hypothetical protein